MSTDSHNRQNTARIVGDGAGAFREQSGLADIGGATLAYSRSGVGETVIFIHADSLDLRQWDGQVAAFSVLYDTVRYDIRGFGQSSVPHDAPYAFAGDLAALMGALGIRRAHLVGSSLGGAIAIEFALEYPHMVSSIVLADAGLAGFSYSDETRSMLGSVVARAKSGDLAGAKRLWLTLPFFAHSMKNPETAAALTRMVADTSGYRWVGENQPQKPPRVPADHVGEIAVPVLALTGANDVADFQAVADSIAARIPGAIRMTLPGAGHLPNMDDPADFNATVLRFLAGVSAPV